jgi:hypothetical protein
LKTCQPPKLKLDSLSRCCSCPRAHCPKAKRGGMNSSSMVIGRLRLRRVGETPLLTKRQGFQPEYPAIALGLSALPDETVVKASLSLWATPVARRSTSCRTSAPGMCQFSITVRCARAFRSGCSEISFDAPLGDSGWAAFSLKPNLPGGKMVLAAKAPMDKGKKRRGATAFRSMYRKIKIHVLKHDQCSNRILSKFRN